MLVCIYLDIISLSYFSSKLLERNEQGHGKSFVYSTSPLLIIAIISVHIAIETLERVSHGYGIVDIPQDLLIYSSQLELKETIGQGKETMDMHTLCKSSQWLLNIPFLMHWTKTLITISNEYNHLLDQ